MNKSELVHAVAEKAQCTLKDAETILESFAAVVEETVAKEESIQWVGFGTFDSKETPARTGRNPRTGEPIQIAAKKVPVFKPGKRLKAALV